MTQKNTNENPLVTFALLTYNQEQFVSEAIEGAFSQTYEPLEIILSDDCSSDGTYMVMQEASASYCGPHRVILNRNAHNYGIGSHVNRIVDLSSGRFIIAAAGDDISHESRTQCLVESFTSSKLDPLSVWSAARYIDRSGSRVNRAFPGMRSQYSDKSMVRNLMPVIGATHAWHRKVFEFFGPLLEETMFEDNAISFRSYLLGEIEYIDSILVSYRTHDGSISNFGGNTDVRSLYSAAERRVASAITGVDQRLEDLELARTKAPRKDRDYDFLRKELLSLRQQFVARKRLYGQFPDIGIGQLLSSLTRTETAKVALRSVLERIRRRF